jgi:uncharacterized protein (DUF885 family)
MHRAVVAYAYEREAKGGARYRFGDTAGYAPFSPFVISQQTGAYYTIPDFLASQHPVATAPMPRRGWPGWRRSRARSTPTPPTLGPMPPRACSRLISISTRRAHRSRNCAASPPNAARWRSSCAEKAAAAGVPGNWAARAAPIIRGAIYPALDRQLAAIDAVRPQARPEPGIWRIPGGDQFYADALAFHTTTTLTPDEVHRLGLAQSPTSTPGSIRCCGRKA